MLCLDNEFFYILMSLNTVVKWERPGYVKIELYCVTYKVYIKLLSSDLKLDDTKEYLNFLCEFVKKKSFY